MSHPHDEYTTTIIISSILDLYYQNGQNLHLRFGHHCMSLVTFLYTIIPCIDELCWPLDRVQISRVWHFLYVIHDNVEGVAMEFALPPPISSGSTHEVILHPKFVYKTLMKVVGHRVPHIHKLHVDPITGMQLSPKSEVRLSSFEAFWFISSEPYVKRYHILKEAHITTLFIATTKLWNGRTRYNLTWLPYCHLNAKELHKRGAESWTTIPCDSSKICKHLQAHEKKEVEVTALIWNVRGSLNARFADNVFVLKEHEKPMLVIITGTTGLDLEAKKIVDAVGYEKIIVQTAKDGECNGFWVMWNTNLLHVQELQSYPNTKHVRIEVPQVKVRRIGTKVKKKGKILSRLRCRG